MLSLISGLDGGTGRDPFFEGPEGQANFKITNFKTRISRSRISRREFQDRSRDGDRNFEKGRVPSNPGLDLETAVHVIFKFFENVFFKF